MLSSTFELLNQANSLNSFVAFIFCNLIIVILLVNNSNNSKNSDNKHVPLSKSYVNKSNCSILDKNDKVTNAIQATTNIKLVAETRDDEEEDDELTRKVEEFIQKVNRSWKAEKLSA